MYPVKDNTWWGGISTLTHSAVKMLKNTWMKKTLRTKSLHLYSKILGQFSVPARANQPPGFPVRGTSTPNGLFQTIKILMGYTIWLHQLKHGVLLHLNFENLELFVNY